MQYQPGIHETLSPTLPHKQHNKTPLPSELFFWNVLLDICRLKLILSTNPWKMQPKREARCAPHGICSLTFNANFLRRETWEGLRTLRILLKRLDPVLASAARRRCSEEPGSHLLEPDLPPGGGGLQRPARIRWPPSQVLKEVPGPKLLLSD